VRQHELVGHLALPHHELVGHLAPHQQTKKFRPQLSLAKHSFVKFLEFFLTLRGENLMALCGNNTVQSTAMTEENLCQCSTGSNFQGGSKYFALDVYFSK